MFGANLLPYREMNNIKLIFQVLFPEKKENTRPKIKISKIEKSKAADVFGVILLPHREIRHVKLFPCRFSVET